MIMIVIYCDYIIIIIIIIVSLLISFLTIYNIYIHVLFMPLFLSFSMHKFSSASGQARSTTPTSPSTSPGSPPSQAPGDLWNEVITSSLWFLYGKSQIFEGCAPGIWCFLFGSPKHSKHHKISLNLPKELATTWSCPHEGGHMATGFFSGELRKNTRRYQQWPTQRLHAKGEDQTGQWLCQQAIHRLLRRPSGGPGDATPKWQEIHQNCS